MLNPSYKKSILDEILQKFLNNYEILVNEIKCSNAKDESYKAIIFKEIQKTSVKSIVRFGKIFNNLEFKNILRKKIIRELGPEYENYFITSKPYLLLHLPNDKLEKGRFHTDVAKNTGISMTCWMPINNYIISYNPITLYLNSQNKFDQILLKIFSKISNDLYGMYANIFKKKILVNAAPFDIYFWQDKTVHRGNFNNTDKKHSALTFKITEKPNPFESSEKISSITESKILSVYSFDDLNEILNNMNKYVEENKKIKNFNDNFYYKTKNHFKFSEDSEKSEILSFASGILAQRLSFTEFKTEAIIFSIISVICGKKLTQIKNSFSYLYIKKNNINISNIFC